MADELSTRDALLKLRRVVADDNDRAERIKDLSKQLDEAVTERAAAVEAALITLEGYVELHSRMHGFSNQLDALIVESKTPGKKRSVRKKKKKKKTTAKAVKSKNKDKGSDSLTGRNPPSRKARATGYKGRLDETIVLSDKEQQFIDVLTARWPLFTTPQFLVRKGIIPEPAHVTAKVNQIRKKGVPIESARQAKQRGEHVTDKSRGYRLIG